MHAAPVEEDLSKGILEAIDMDSYRVEKQAARSSCPMRMPGSDRCRVQRMAASPSPSWTGCRTGVAADPAYQNAAKNSDKQSARIEFDVALRRVVVGAMKDDTELFKQFMDNESFRRWMSDTVFSLTYRQPASSA